MVDTVRKEAILMRIQIVRVGTKTISEMAESTSGPEVYFTI